MTIENTKVIFMGTPEFAVPVLDMLIHNTDVLGIITKKDELVGRKKVLTKSPVKVLGEKYDIPVYTPNKMSEVVDTIKELNPDIIITCAFGKIVPESILNIPKLGCINVHASLLPRWRGASPMQYAIMSGDKVTGTTIMYMDKGLDTGDMISKVEVPIKESDTLGTIESKLMEASPTLLKETLIKIINNTNDRIKQDDTNTTYASLITRDMEHLDLNDKGINLVNKIRAFNPHPYTYLNINNEEYKITEAYFKESNTNSIGKVVEIGKDYIGISVSDGILCITKLKPFGKKQMDVKSYLNGIKKEVIESWIIK